MFKKVLSVLMCCMLIMTNLTTSVFAKSKHELTLDNYYGYGEVKIFETTANAKTYISPLANVYVYAEYNYVVNRNESPATMAMLQNSIGDSGTAYVTFSRPYPSRSFSIFGSHTIYIPGVSPYPLPPTDAFYP